MHHDDVSADVSHTNYLRIIGGSLSYHIVQRSSGGVVVVIVIDLTAVDDPCVK